MKQDEINWLGGRVVYWDLDRISDSIPIKNQIRELKEDLAQVEYNPDTILDVGWYPEFSEKGRFVVKVVRNQDWESPVYHKECRNIPELFELIRSAIESR